MGVLKSYSSYSYANSSSNHQMTSSQLTSGLLFNENIHLQRKVAFSIAKWSFLGWFGWMIILSDFI